jgi:hypothetical protein
MSAKRKAKEEWKENLRDNLHKLNTIIVYIGFVSAVIVTIISPVLLNFLVVGLYVVQFIILKVLESMDHRDWGYLYDTESGVRVSGGFVRLYDIKESRQLDVQLTDEAGRYGFAVKEGKYHMKADAEGYKFPASQMKASRIFRSLAGEVFAKVDSEKGRRIDIAIPLDREAKSDKTGKTPPGGSPFG